MSCLKKLCGGGRTVLIFLFLFVASNNSCDNLKQNISTLGKLSVKINKQVIKY